VCGISIDHGPGPVERGLAWLIEHQLDEGSWSFDLNDCAKCSGQCSHSGEVPDRPGATRLEATSSAAGLLCRLFLGWKPDSPALQDGVRRLAGVGLGTDLLFDYYATQLMHQLERDACVAWFDTMKPLLLKAQASEGHEAGSLHEGFRGTHPLFVGGGRLQSTALAAMILEVYYRHLPLYQDASCPAKVEQKHPPHR
jgi:hypothetical protein